MESPLSYGLKNNQCEPVVSNVADYSLSECYPLHHVVDSYGSSQDYQESDSIPRRPLDSDFAGIGSNESIDFTPKQSASCNVQKEKKLKPSLLRGLIKRCCCAVPSHIDPDKEGYYIDPTTSHTFNSYVTENPIFSGESSFPQTDDNGRSALDSTRQITDDTLEELASYNNMPELVPDISIHVIKTSEYQRINVPGGISEWSAFNLGLDSELGQ